MLNSETKRRIDTARDILVGKVPDPKSQVEQITIALIYKFMNDMDAQAEEIGGKRRFFAGDFEKYGWSKLMAAGMGGHEVLNLYAEALTKMNEHVNIPPLFRDIFKNAYLPYRDPETLKSFLKVIDDFEYDHSERLGDAFEYLLSVLGSQGDAGQFRTPRHIIDFMVAVIDPRKNETILDPACGTAGFLISAYKHILKENSSNYEKDKDPYAFELHGVKLEELTADTGKKYKGDKLTPDERNRLIHNICGYDISPDMVRLSLVNLYLHGFPDPHIYEYDTLTSEDRWNEYYDIIFANPPFMSPKGGIRPHKRFSVDSSRSEVLFVDYMAEHLTPNGRCAVVVPEGVIFQTGTAYKSLRKMLVDENYLVGVISLPAGVFNPYSGVKTSILWLDKSLAKKTDKILFVKIENDGFDLGAQRRPIKQNDLPQAFQQIAEYKEAILNGEQFEFKDSSKLILVEKNEIGKNGDFNLSGERYKETSINHTEFPLVELGEVCVKITDGSHFSPETTDEGFPYITVKDLNNGTIDFKNCKRISEKHYLDLVNNGCKPELNDVLFSKDGTVGKTALINFQKDFVVLSSLAIIRPDMNKVTPNYLYRILSTDYFINKAVENKTGVAIRRIVLKTLKTIKIPLPPPSVQEEIVAEIESYQKIIDGARQVVENYQPRIDIDPEWTVTRMIDIAVINDSSKHPSNLYSDWFTYIDITSVENGTGQINYNNKIAVKDAPSRARRLLKRNDILLSTVRPNLQAFGFIDIEPNRLIASTGFAVISTKENCIPKYLYYLMFQDYVLDQMISRMGKGSYPSINQQDVSELEIPLPDLRTQQEIVTQIEREKELVKANKQLIEIFERKIKDRIAKVWGE